MAKNTSVQLLDDITGAPAEETVRFALHGVQYDIDLSAGNAEELRAILERYARHGRRTGGRKRARRIIALPKRSRTTKAAAKPAAKKAAKKAEPRKAAPKATAESTAAAKTTTARTTASTKAGPKAPAKTSAAKAATAKTAPRTTPAGTAKPARAETVKKPAKAPVVRFSAAE
jgi:hypothetical protein